MDHYPLLFLELSFDDHEPPSKRAKISIEAGPGLSPAHKRLIGTIYTGRGSLLCLPPAAPVPTASAIPYNQKI